MGKILTFTFNGSGSQTWTPETECVLQGIKLIGTAVAGFVTTDPALTTANILSLVQRRSDIFYYAVSSAPAAGGMSSGTQLNIPVHAGETYYLVTSSSGMFQLIYDEIVS